MRPLDSEMVEFAFLLPDWQASALESAAHQRGLTAGQMVRTLLSRFFDAQECVQPDFSNTWSQSTTSN